MGGNLVIVESPGKIKKIQEFLGKDYIVKASIGHIRDLQEKKLSIDIDHNFEPEYVVPSDKKKVVAELKKLAKQVDTVWLASDADREGEAISWHLSQTLELDPAKTKRIVSQEITKEAFLEAIKNPRAIDMNLVNAQQARRVLDRLVGFELSPILWKKIRRGLSAGRVQSVALRLIVDREREIMTFVPVPYYKVEGCFKIGKTKIKGQLDTKFQTLEEAERFLKDSIGATYRVDNVSKKEGSRNPAAPFTTSTLQQEAGRKLHFPVSTTMRVAQSLYEKGLITYMRTDSTNLSSLALGTAKKYIAETFGEAYCQPRQFKTKSKGAQEAHEAIRPTFIANEQIGGTVQEQKLYSLIWKRTVASQMASAKVMNTTVGITSDKREERFSVQAAEVLFDGFLRLYIEGSDDEQQGEDEIILPKINIGDIPEECGINAECKYTAPPFRYSQPSLVKKLEELGIGRPSTYATIITTLTTGRGYVVMGDKEGNQFNVTNLSLSKGVITTSEKVESVGAEKGKLIPADIGIMVSDYLVGSFPDIMNYDFTAKVEEDFDKIAEGKLVWNSVISGFYSPFHCKVDEAMADRQYSNHLSREIGTAPDGEVLIAKFGKYGPYIQKGEAEKKQFANLGKGQLIETITMEEALKLFELPRTIGEYKNTPIIATKGRFGPFLKFGSQNVSLPRGADPLSISLEECERLIDSSLSKTNTKKILVEYKNGDIQVLDGMYGPYIKYAGSNYKIPKGTAVEELTEAICLEIILKTQPTHKKRTYGKLQH